MTEMEERPKYTKEDHSDSKALKKLIDLLKNLPKQSELKMSPKLRNGKETGNDHKILDSPTPIAKKLRKRKSKSVDYPKIDNFSNQRSDCSPLKKVTQIQGIQNFKSTKNKPSVAPTRSKENLITNRPKKRKIKGISPSKQSSLEDYFNKPDGKSKTKKQTKCESSFKRSESSDSCELPTFKSSRKPIRKNKEKASFKKYGISTPSVDEILQDKIDLEKHRHQMEAFQLQPLRNTSFELPFSTKDFDKTSETEENVLDCKSLSFSEITRIFEINLQHLSDVINGRVYNDRHERYHDKNNKLFTLTPRDLSYSTSMIVFTFEQTEHMLSLLKNKFDPKDDKTPYFFQVLLPELCLRIFMEAHQMSLEEAVIYLEERPPVGD